MRRQLFSGAIIAFGGLLGLGCGKKTEPLSTEPPAAVPGGPAPATAPTEADKAEAAKRLRRIMVALFEHHDSNQVFPAGIVGPKGQVGLSWRVAVLPFLGEQEAELYKQFNTKEPWDSEHNKKLIEQMPKVYASPGAAAASGKTHFRAFSGPMAFILEPKGAAPGGKQVPGTFVRGRRVTDFMDGTSNTLAVAEAAEAVEWTKPDEIPFLDEQAVTTPGAKLGPVPKLGGVFPGGFHGVLADGAVHFFPDTLSENDLRALMTVNGGETLSPTVLAILRAPKPKVPDADRPVPPRGSTSKTISTKLK